METKSIDAVKALEMTASVFDTDLTPAELTETYDNWSTNYEEMLTKSMYMAPSIAVEEIGSQIPEEQRKKSRVLDVAAGTGMVGNILRKMGFTNMDALEPSEGMMKILRDTNVYNLKYQEFIGHGQNTVPQDTYDLVVISGGMGNSHIPVSGIDDLIRVAKPGCLVVIVMRLEFLETVKAYQGKLEPYMDLLEQKGLWKKVTRKVVPNYFFKKEGVVFTYRVQ